MQIYPSNITHSEQDCHTFAPKSYTLGVLRRGRGRFGDQFGTWENFLLNASGCVYSWIRARIVDSCRRVRGSTAL